MLSDAERNIGLVVPDGLDANTLSGSCMAALGEMPDIGDEVTEYGYRFTTQNLENHQVGRLIIEKLDATDERNQDTETGSPDAKP